MTIETLKSSQREIYQAALKAVDPEKAVRSSLQRQGDCLRLAGTPYTLSDYRKVFLVGTGKAGVPMARAVEDLLGERLDKGLIVVKHGHGGDLQKTRVLEAGHPEPDEDGRRATEALLSFLHSHVGEQDLLLVLLSGGGSALLPAPVAEISFEAKQATNATLLRSGATIHEINAIRKHLSRVKGGRLIEHAGGAQILSLMLSDVVDDDLTSIASGPTVPDPTRFEDCLRILAKYKIKESTPPEVLSYLRRGAGSETPGIGETPKPGDSRFSRVQNAIVASNIVALKAAAEKARTLGFAPLILSSSIAGNNGDVALVHTALAREVLRSGLPIQRPCCIISGGETTVRVTGNGKGGRSQDFALCCAAEIADWDFESILFTSLGSDGTDGPTDAAGAWASPQTAARAQALNLSLEDFLARNDSYHFFLELGDLIITGPTQTNVMDLRFILIE